MGRAWWEGLKWFAKQWLAVQPPSANAASMVALALKAAAGMAMRIIGEEM